MVAGAMPTYHEGLLICPTGAGAMVAIDLGDQTLRWGVHLERNQEMYRSVGGRGRANTGGVSGEQIVALCDTNPDALAQAKQRFPDAKTSSDWRELMDDSSIDGVVISTADHHHALAALAAMRAGKHVYCEKPLTRTVHEHSQ